MLTIISIIWVIFLIVIFYIKTFDRKYSRRYYISVFSKYSNYFGSLRMLKLLKDDKMNFFKYNVILYGDSTSSFKDEYLRILGYSLNLFNNKDSISIYLKFLPLENKVSLYAIKYSKGKREETFLKSFDNNGFDIMFKVEMCSNAYGHIIYIDRELFMIDEPFGLHYNKLLSISRILNPKLENKTGSSRPITFYIEEL